MIFYNYSDTELRIINNTMSEFCNELRGINFQSLFFKDEEFLENILDRVNTTLNARRFYKYSNLDDLILLQDFDASEIKVVVKMLQEIFEYMHDISHDGKADIASYAFKLTQKKLQELLSQMIADSLSNDEVALMNYFFNEFFQELRIILSKTQDQDVLDNILCDMHNILENQGIVGAWGSDNLISRLGFNQEQIYVLIKALKLLPRYFKDVEVDTMIGGSFLQIDVLIRKIEHWQFGMKFNIISDDSLNVIYNVINEFVYELSNVDYQGSFACDKQFLENLLSTIMMIMDNRIFFKKWGDYIQQESFSFDVDQMKVVITMLENISIYINDADLAIKVGTSLFEIKEIKDRLETLLSE